MSARIKPNKGNGMQTMWATGKRTLELPQQHGCGGTKGTGRSQTTSTRTSSSPFIITKTFAILNTCSDELHYTCKI